MIFGRMVNSLKTCWAIRPLITNFLPRPTRLPGFNPPHPPTPSLWVLQRQLTLILLQRCHDTNGRHIAIQMGGVYTNSNQQDGMLLRKYPSETNVSCIAVLFKSIMVRNRCHSLTYVHLPQNCAAQRTSAQGDPNTFFTLPPMTTFRSFLACSF